MKGTKYCLQCGAEFEYENSKQLYCTPRCSKTFHRSREKAQKVIRKAKRPIKKTGLKDIVAEAREMGLSYGQYVALKGV
jgi:uncharacterized Zn ribbon protein